jgi:hypothetical protein
MTTSEYQLDQLMAQNAVALAQLTSVMTSFTFELMRSSDPDVRRACGHALAKLTTVSSEMNQQWASIAEFTGVPRLELNPVEEVVLVRKA